MRKLYTLSALLLLLTLAGTAWSDYLPNWQLFERAAEQEIVPSNEDDEKSADLLRSSAACSLDASFKPYTYTDKDGNTKVLQGIPVTKCDKNPDKDGGGANKGNGMGELEIILKDNGKDVNEGQYDITWYRSTDLYGTALGTGSVLSTFEPDNYTAVIQPKDPACPAVLATALIADETDDLEIKFISIPSAFECDKAQTVTVEVLDVGGNQFQVEWYKDGKFLFNNKTTMKNMGPGVYTLIGYNNDSGCSTDTTLVVGGIVYRPLVEANVTANTNCDIGNGSVTFTVNAPEGTNEPANGYTYSLVDEAGNTYAVDPSTLTSEDLLGGIYTLTVGNPAYDSNGNFLGDCGVDFTFTIDEALEYPEATLTPTDNTICAEGNGVLFNGALSASITLGGTAVTDLTGYELIWKKGVDFASATEISLDEVSSLSNLSGGTYWLSVKSPAGCLMQTPASAIIADTPPTYTLTTTPTPQTNCDTPPNGSIATNFMDDAGNPVSGATYQWFQGSSSSGTQLGSTGAIATGLAGNQTYTVIATDPATNCTAEATLTLGLNQVKPTFTTSTSPNIGCVDGKYTGSITAALPTGTTGTYTYTFYQGNSATGTPLQQGTSNTITGQPADSYTVVVTNNATGCSSDPVAVSIINDLGALSISYASTPQTLCNATNGSVTATLDGATGTVTYQWTDASGNSVGSGSSVSGLAGGETYTVSATDEGTGCALSQNVSVALQQEKPVFTLAPTANTGCVDGKYTGQVTATLDPAFSGSSDFSYAWYTGTTADEANRIDGQTTVTLSGQPAGDYTFVATNNTTSCASDARTATINNNLPSFTIALTPTAQTNCTGTPNGQIVAEMQNATGGAVTGANYEWFEGNTADAANTRTDLSGATAANLEGGKTYTVRATDPTSGCTTLNTVSLPLTQETPVLNLDAVVDNNGCTTGYNGSVTVSVSGYSDPSATFTYQWYNGSAVDAANRRSESIANISGLQEGDYTVVAVHSTLGCVSDPITATVAFVKENYTLSLTPTDQTNCSTPANGAILAELEGATNVSYTFYEGSGTGGTQLSSQTAATATLDELEGDKTYTIVATDNVTGCSYQEEVQLQLTQPTYQLNYSVSPNTICDPANSTATTNNGSITASIVASNTATTGDFTYSWTNPDGSNRTETGSSISGLQAGTYKVTATHGTDGCIAAEIEVEVTDALTAINLDASSTPNEHCDTNYSGTATVTLADGTDISGNTDYTINWYAGGTATGSSIGTATILTGQAAGEYTAEVFYNPTGCSNTTTVEISDDLKQVQITSVTPTPFDCDPSLTASLTADVNVDGTAVMDYTGYTFIWERIDAAGNVMTPISTEPTSTPNNQITGLSYAGNYRVTVTDPFGCSATRQYNLAPAPPEFTITLTPTTYPNDCASAPIGQLEASVTDLAGNPVSVNQFEFYWYEDYPANASSGFFGDPDIDFGTLLQSGQGGGTGNGHLLSNLGQGVYTVVAENISTGCQAFVSRQLPLLTAPMTVATASDVEDCAPSNTGEIEVEVQDKDGNPIASDFADFDVYLFDGSVTDFSDLSTALDSESLSTLSSSVVTFTNLAVGDYKIIAIDNTLSNCNPPSELVTIKQLVVAPVADVSSISPNTVCNTNYNGSVTIDLSKGEYEAGETDPVTSHFSLNWTSVPGSTSPGTGPYAPGSPNFPNLAPGSYTVEITGLQADGAGGYTQVGSACPTTLNFTIPNQPVKPVVAAESTPLDNCGTSATLSISSISFGGSVIYDGTPSFPSNYSISWKDEGGVEVGTSTSYSTDIAGTYSVSVTNTDNGCASNTVTLNLEDQRVDPIINFAVTHNTSCDVTGTNANGEVTATVTTDGATATSYTYAWYAGTTAIPGSEVDSDNTLNNAAPGTYLLVATDGDNNCDVSKTVVVEDKPIYPTITKLVADNQEGCGNNIPGTLTVTEVRFNGTTYSSTSTDLNTLFDFSWSDGTNTVTDSDSDNSMLTAAAGIYSVVATVKGSTGFNCPSSAKEGTITRQAAYPTISLVSNTPNVNCDETAFGSTGQLEVSALTNGTDNGYDYEWTTSAGTTVGSNSATLSALAAGTYTVKVTDQLTGCFSSRSFRVTNDRTTPDAPTLSISGELNDCTVPGEITVTVVSPGTTSDYEFIWYNSAGDIVQAQSSATSFSTNTGGQYAVVAVSQITGCSSAAGYINLPDKRTYPNATYTITPNTSCVGFNGSIEVTSITAGTSGSSAIFHWNDLSASDPLFREATRSNLEPGDYSFTLTENGCEKIVTVNVPDEREYFPIILEMRSTKQTECNPNGTLEVTEIEIDGTTYTYDPETGAGDNLNDFFNFNWYDADGNLISGEDQSLITGLISGEYSVEAIRTGADIPVGNGCPSARVSNTVGREGDFPEISFSITANQNCTGAGTGSITANVTGGTGDYTYSWIGRTETIASLANLSGGEYTLTVTDEAGCTTTQSVTIPDEPLYPQVTKLQMSDNTYCNAYNGTLTVAEVTFNGTAYSGTNLSQFTFQWYDANEVAITGETGLSLTGMPAGDYYVTAKQTAAPGAGCPSPLFPGSLRNTPANPVVEIVATPNQSCGSHNGELTANVSGGSGNYTYAWYGPGHAGTDQVTISNLPPGDYEVLVTDNTSGCTLLVPYTLNEELAYPTIADISVNPIDQCEGVGSIVINSMSEGSFTDFTFSWMKDGEAYAGNVTSISGGEGTYAVTIKANNPALIGFDCEATYEYQITDETPALDVFLYDWRMINGCSETGMLEIRADEYADATDPNYTFVWEDADGNILNGDGSNRIDNLLLGEYTYTVFNNLTNCSVMGTFSVTEAIVNPFLIASAEGQWMCTPEDGRLAVRVDNYADLKKAIGAVSFQFDWFRGEHASNPGQNSPDYITSGVSIADPNVDVASMVLNDQPHGVYTVFARQIGGNQCQALPDMATVLDLRTYPVPQIEIAQPLRNCDPAKPNGMLTGSVGGIIEGYDFEWYEGTDLSLDPIATGPEFNEAKAIRYTLLAIDQTTQCSDTVSMVVPEDYFLVEADPFWVDQEPSLSCLQPNGRLFLTEDSLADNYIFRWYAGSEVIADSLLATDVTGLDGLSAGVYTITAQNRAHGCISDGMQVILDSDYYFPAVDLKITPATCTEAGYVEIIDLDGQVADYYWSDGTNIFYGETFTGDAGEYFVTIISEEGCSTTLPFEIDEVIKPYNAISANGDGQNDHFHINCIDMFPKNLVKIYNRAGVLVFELEGYNNNERVFTGTGNRGIYLNGQNLPDGTYFYVIDRKNGSRPEHGFLELIR